MTAFYRVAGIVMAALLLLVASGGAAYALWRGGFNYAGAKKDAEIARLKEAHALALSVAVVAASGRYEQDARQKAEKETQLLHDKRLLESQRDTLQQKLRERMNRDALETLAPAVSAAFCLPRPVFSVEWLCDYNAALGLSADKACAVAGVVDRKAGSSEATDTWLRLWLQDSGVTADDVLSHAIDYGHHCRGLDAQVNRLIDTLESQEIQP